MSKYLFLLFIIFLVLADIFFFVDSSDLRIFALLFIYILIVKYFKLRSSVAFVLSLLFLLFAFTQFIFANPVLFINPQPPLPKAEKAAVWSFLFLMCGLVQELLEINIRKRVVSIRDMYFYSRLEKSLSGCNSVLDVGCGSNSPLWAMKKKIYSEGIDVHRPSITESKKKGIHTKYKIGNIEKIDYYYKSHSFDAVIAMDVIEHFTKEDGITLLKKMERIARKKVIVLTPNGFLHQGQFEDNRYQDHKSGWSITELQSRGYKVFGLRSFKFLRGEFASINKKPWFFWAIIAFITEPLLYYFPKFSFHLFAIKEV